MPNVEDWRSSLASFGRATAPFLWSFLGFGVVGVLTLIWGNDLGMPAWPLWLTFIAGVVLASFLAYDRVRRERDAALALPWLEDLAAKFDALLMERPRTRRQYTKWEARAGGPRNQIEEHPHPALSKADRALLVNRDGLPQNPAPGLFNATHEGWWLAIHDARRRVEELISRATTTARR